MRVAESGAGLHSSLLCDTSEYIFIFQKSCAEHGLNRCFNEQVEHRADCVVIGSHGFSMWDKTLCIYGAVELMAPCFEGQLSIYFQPFSLWSLTENNYCHSNSPSFRPNISFPIRPFCHFLGQLQLHSGCHGAQKPVNWVDKVSRKVIHLGYVREVVHKFAK